MTNLKNKRAPKQLGDFGEQLVTNILVQYKNMSAAVVDHVGADLIVSNKKDRYAVSVKSRIIPEDESKSFVFSYSHIDNLKEFANDYNMIPTLAFVVNEPIDVIKVFIFTSDTLEKISDSNSKLSNKIKEGYSFNYHRYNPNNIQNDLEKKIFYTEFNRTTMNDFNI